MKTLSFKILFVKRFCGFYEFAMPVKALYDGELTKKHPGQGVQIVIFKLQITQR